MPIHYRRIILWRNISCKIRTQNSKNKKFDPNRLSLKANNLSHPALAKRGEMEGAATKKPCSMRDFFVKSKHETRNPK